MGPPRRRVEVARGSLRLAEPPLGLRPADEKLPPQPVGHASRRVGLGLGLGLGLGVGAGLRLWLGLGLG